MKFIPSQLAYFFTEPDARRNTWALGKYLFFIFFVIVVYSVVFHIIMLHAEGHEHSWVTGFYWTLTVMTTLGFGDITFQTDVGRLFSILVLLSGIILLLIVLPFAFIRFFYAPWLEARVRLQAPREAPEDSEGHVIICNYGDIAPGLIDRLNFHGIPYTVIEPDPTEAGRMHGDGISVVTGEVDSPATYQALKTSKARLVFANRNDTMNTNITLTVREIAPAVPVVAVIEEEDSADILELAGCSHVLPLKQRLGERLANRVNAGHSEAHVIGTFRDLQLAEFPVHNTPLAGRTIRDIGLREAIGINIVAVWERGRLLPAHPDTVLSNSSVTVVVGTPSQILELNTLLVIYDTNYNPVLVIGGGKVGQATAREFKKKGIPVYIVERNESMRDPIGDIPDRLFIGDAADREVLMGAGLNEAPSVILTTNDDAMNIYLAVYCRRLNPELRIVSRITHERNIEAIHRAGADFALSYASLGMEYVFSILQGRELMVLGEGVELFAAQLPPSLAGQTLAQSAIATRTGLTVIGIQHNEKVTSNPPPSTTLSPGSELLLLGNTRQRQAFTDAFS